MSASVAKRTKPILRGLVKAYVVRAFLFSSTLSCFAGWSYKHWVADPRKRAYEDFYVNYDPNAEADRLYKMGLIRSWKDNDDVPDNPIVIPY